MENAGKVPSEVRQAMKLQSKRQEFFRVLVTSQYLLSKDSMNGYVMFSPFR